MFIYLLFINVINMNLKRKKERKKSKTKTCLIDHKPHSNAHRCVSVLLYMYTENNHTSKCTCIFGRRLCTRPVARATALRVFVLCLVGGFVVFLWGLFWGRGCLLLMFLFVLFVWVFFSHKVR